MYNEQPTVQHGNDPTETLATTDQRGGECYKGEDDLNNKQKWIRGSHKAGWGHRRCWWCDAYGKMYVPRQAMLTDDLEF